MSLVELRRLAGFSQRALADEVGVTYSEISDIERGKNKNPSVTLVVNIVRAFQRRGLEGVTADDVFSVPQPSDGSREAVTS